MSFLQLSTGIPAIFLFAHWRYLYIKAILEFLNDSTYHLFQFFYVLGLHLNVMHVASMEKNFLLK